MTAPIFGMVQNKVTLEGSEGGFDGSGNHQRRERETIFNSALSGIPLFRELPSSIRTWKGIPFQGGIETPRAINGQPPIRGEKVGDSVFDEVFDVFSTHLYSEFQDRKNATLEKRPTSTSILYRKVRERHCTTTQTPHVLQADGDRLKRAILGCKPIGWPEASKVGDVWTPGGIDRTREQDFFVKFLAHFDPFY